MVILPTVFQLFFKGLFGEKNRPDPLALLPGLDSTGLHPISVERVAESKRPRLVDDILCLAEKFCLLRKISNDDCNVCV